MRRGTTPTLTLTVDADLLGWTMYVALRAGGETLVLEGERLDASAGTEEGTTDIALTLTQAETLAMSSGPCEVQLRAARNGSAVATDIARIDVGRIIQDGEIDG